MMAKIQVKKLSYEETREILTPLAFKIDKSLFGISLAVPWRRGMALLVDLCLVALLSGAPGELLAFLVAITLFKLGSRKRGNKLAKKRALSKIILRVFAALIVFVVLIDILPKLFAELETFNHDVEQAGQSQGTLSSNKIQSHAENMTEANTNVSEDNDFIKAALTLAAGVATSQTDCVDYPCWLQLCESLSSAYSEQTASRLEINKFNADLLERVAKQSRLSQQEITQLSVQLEKLPLAAQTKPPLIKDKVEKKVAVTGAEQSNTTSEIDKNKPTVAVPSSSSVYKGFAWLQGLVEDLGLGFGWAAFYFTMFTALWNGQTPGKKLFSIRVIQLDGTPLSIWDSFGRYGGYGAGIATGLLGFAQIFWDPNRQAIHDKISATIVVNDTNIDTESKISSTNTAEQTVA
ncbi:MULTISPECIES: RDD family protein [unclassified Colwellia]|uniref:RDD family protein n=1 Tax=unclassified Colwellia TaxID=196834 RepID=UPI002174DA0B|nr:MULTISPECIES: RDD family protein [unclassified Colwellia]